MDVCTYAPALLPSYYAQGFGVNGVRSANGFFEDSREDNFLLCLSGNSVSGTVIIERKDIAYLPTSNAGEAIGLSSVVIVKIPSNFLSGSGSVTWAEICTATL